MYKGYIPVIEIEDGFKILASFAIPALERLDNYPGLIALYNIARGEIDMLKATVAAQSTDIGLWKEKYKILQISFDKNQEYYANKIHAEQWKSFWIGAGVGGGVVGVLVTIIVILANGASTK